MSNIQKFVNFVEENFSYQKKGKKIFITNKKTGRTQSWDNSFSPMIKGPRFLAYYLYMIYWWSAGCTETDTLKDYDSYISEEGMEEIAGYFMNNLQNYVKLKILVSFQMFPEFEKWAGPISSDPRDWIGTSD